MTKFKKKNAKQSGRNTFKFEKFAQRLAKVNVDVFHKIGQRSEAPDGVGTFFCESVRKWNDLNCSQSYENFKKDLRFSYVSLPQVLLFKEDIVASLEKHLAVEESLAYAPLLDFVVALSRDLQSEFYLYFPRIFKVVVNLLRTNDTEQLENTFRCLAYLFKFLWRYMIKDIDNVFSLYSPLLGANQKEHIQNFASESISFLLRKVRDKNALVDLLFTSLTGNSGMAEGVGLLLFDVMRGFQQRFHSCFDDVFYLVLTKLGCGCPENDVTFSWREVYVAQEKMLKSLLAFTNAEFSYPMWDLFLKMIQYLKDQLADPTKEAKAFEHLERILKLFGVAVSFRNGKCINSLSQITKTILTLLEMENISEKCSKSLIKMVSSILRSPSLNLDDLVLTKLVSTLFDGKFSKEIKFGFVRSMYNYKEFENNVLSVYLLYVCRILSTIDDDESKREIVSEVVELALNFRPQHLDASKLADWDPFPIEFDFVCGETTGDELFADLLTSLLSVRNIEENIQMFWMSIVCLPHLRGTSIGNAVNAAKLAMKVLLGKCLSKAANVDVLFLLCQTVESLIHMLTLEELIDMITTDDIKRILLNYPTEVYCLRLADFYFTHLRNCDAGEILSESLASELFLGLQPNIASPHHQIRLLTLRIFCSFDLTLPDPDCKAEAKNVFQICLSAETIEVGIDSYRERIRHLQCLEHRLVQDKLPIGPYEKVPLYYAIGTLYVNFRLLWDPVSKLIASHAKGMDSNEFWEVYSKFLFDAADRAERELAGVIEDSDADDTVDDPKSIYFIVKSQIGNLEDRISYATHRERLWNTLCSFVEVAESNNKDVVTLLFRCLKNECYNFDGNQLSTEDVRRNSDDSEQLDTMETEDVEENGEEEENTESLDVDNESRVVPQNKCCSISSIKVFCYHLELCSNFRNPRNVYREPELTELYFYLLGYPFESVQKVALDCILSYHHTFLNSYRDNLLRLMDNKTFRSEIILFSIDANKGVVLEAHREGLMPFLMRILLGKMMRKSGTGGKDNARFRQKVILQFIASSRAEEIHVFLDMAFLPFKHILEGNTLTLVRSIMDDLDFSAVVPLRKQQGVLRFLSIVFAKLSHQITSVLPRMFKMIVCITARVAVLLKHRDKVGSEYLKMLKSLRILAMSRIIQFFNLFKNYDYTKDEINALFEAVIWPLIRFSNYREGPLLKLFKCWSSHARYFVLLTKHHKDDVSISPLDEMMNLLVSRFVDKSTTSLILDSVKVLVTIDDNNRDLTKDGYGNFDHKEIVKPIEVDDVVVKSHDQSDKQGRQNYGTFILLPHLSKILTKLKEVFETYKKGKNYVVPARNITILYRLCEFVDDPKYSSSLLSLLLPILKRKMTMEEDDTTDILNLVTSLLRFAEGPKQFLRTLIKMFLTCSARQIRASLCRLLDIIAERDESAKSIATMATELNAYDPKQMEEPDYNVRLKAFREATKIITDCDTMDQLFWLLIMNNCIFFLKNEADYALQSNASKCLQQIAIAFGSFSDEKRKVASQFLKDTLLPEIRSGLKLKKESTRHEFISILASFVRNCHSYVELSDLHQLTSENPEQDFFVKICDIQIPDRAKTLLKLCSRDKCNNMSEYDLTEYMMPIVTSFLFDDEYKKYYPLVEAAVGAVGYICSKLSWQSYEYYLMYYLDNLPNCADHKKMAVNVLVAVLDAFHFDLSLSEVKEVEPFIPIKGRKRKYAEIKDIVVEEEKKASFDVVPANMATKIHETISKGILPSLYECLCEKAKKDIIHELATEVTKKYYAIDEEILRVPLALAMIKLLKRLPVSYLESNLPGILLKVCNFLKSRADGIRIIARKTLQSIMVSLGAKYMHYLVKEMRSILTRGYQVHVMIFTINTIFQRMVKTLACGDLDTCLADVQQVCHEEMFGNVAEEKTVGAFIQKVKESKGTKSYCIYEVLAKFVSESCLTDLIVPLKDVLAKTTNHRDVYKIQHCLNGISKGLLENKGISSKNLLIFLYGIVNEKIPEFNEQISKSSNSSDKPKIDKHRIRPDTFLIMKEPGRNKAVARVSARTNAHVLIEFAVQLLYSCLKNNKIATTGKQVLEMLDPFLPLLSNCLQSTYIQLTTASLYCLMFLIKCPLPTRPVTIGPITTTTFALLKQYCRAGMSQGDNLSLVVACFQLLTAMLRDVKTKELSEDQYRILLAYVEQDVSDHTKQATAFKLLKAILSKKIQLCEVTDIMEHVSKLMITSEVDHIRLQCRQCMLQYLLDYPGSKLLLLNLEFIVTQLDYEQESGRESALEMLTSIFTAFPTEVLSQHSVIFFVPISARLVNDVTIKCRKMAAIAIKILLERISVEERDKLFSVVKTWLQDTNRLHKKLAAQLCGLFVEVEKKEFERRLAEFLPVLVKELNPENHNNLNEEDLQSKADHVLFQLLTTVCKTLTECPVIRIAAFREDLNRLWDLVRQHLLHPHIWVRLVSCQLFGLLFAAYPPEEVAFIAKSKKNKQTDYLLENYPEKLRLLASEFFDQLKSRQLIPELGDQIARNLVYFAKLLNMISPKIPKTKGKKRKLEDDEPSEEIDDRLSDLSIDWLFTNLSEIAYGESTSHKFSSFKRMCFFKWIAAVVTVLGADALVDKLPVVIPHLTRASLSERFANEDLKNLAKGVLDLLQNATGVETFSQEYVKSSMEIAKMKQLRKQKLATMAVEKPMKAARLKLKLREARKIAKKRKSKFIRDGKLVPKKIQRTSFKKKKSKKKNTRDII